MNERPTDSPDDSTSSSDQSVPLAQRSETAWDRLNLSLNRLESAILAKQYNLAKPAEKNASGVAEEETLERLRRERDILKKAVESALYGIRTLLRR